MPNPWDNDPIVAAPTGGPIYGLPRQPPMQTPDQAQGQSLQNVHTGQEIASQPLQNANTQTNIAQGQQSIASSQQQMGLSRVSGASDLQKSFRSDPTVQAYREVVPMVAAAEAAKPGGAGDNSVVYGWAKAMDPTGSVREGDVQMAQSASAPLQRAQLLISQYHLAEGGNLPPELRTALIEEMRNKARQLEHQYAQVRAGYIKSAQDNGLDPTILGPHEYAPFQATEEAYIRAHGGTPKLNGVPIDQGAPQKTIAGFDGELPRNDPLPKSAENYRDGLYNALRSGEIKSPASLKAWEAQFNQQHGTNFNANLSAKQTMQAIGAARSGKAFNVDLPKYNPNISDVRGGQNTPNQDRFNATARGILDTPSFGTIDKLVAGTDTLFKGGTMDENLARQYAISDYDQANHPGFRIAGQIGGGALLPMGEMSSVPQIVGKSAALGGSYGVGSSRSLSDVPMNALLGAAGGAAVGGALGGAGRGIAALRGAPKEIPPLVDPVTGELNQPMDAMRPAERVQAMQDYGMTTVTPGMAGGRSARIGEQVLNNLPASAGHMEDVNSLAGKELRRSMQGVAQQFGSSKTLNEGGAALQQGTKQWMTRFDEVTGKAYDAIPISGEAKASTTSTTATLQNLTARLKDNPGLAQEISDPVLQRYLGAIEKGGLSWQGMKEFRTFIGNKIGQFRLSEDARTGDYRALYGALSQDMRDTAASMGPRALSAFERANTLKAQGEQRIETALATILGPDAKARPELAAAAIQRMTQGGKAGGDLRALAQVRASTIKSGAWDEIASTLIHLGGQPAKSEGRAFEPATFVKWYADMAEPARRMLFKPELRESLDGFVAMNQQLSRVKGLANTSNSGALVLAGAQLLQLGKMIMSADVTGIGIQLGANALNYGLAKAWTTPAFVKLLTGFGRSVASGNENAVRSQMGRLAKLATTNPELRQPIESLLRSLNDNAPIPGQIAASPDQGPGNSAQPQ